MSTLTVIAHELGDLQWVLDLPSRLLFEIKQQLSLFSSHDLRCAEHLSVLFPVTCVQAVR